MPPTAPCRCRRKAANVLSNLHRAWRGDVVSDGRAITTTDEYQYLEALNYADQWFDMAYSIC